MDAPALRFDGVSKVYRLYDSPRDRLKEALHPFGKSYHRDFRALNDVSFEVPRGEILGIVGRNGAGKSTLLKLASGVLQPSAGQISAAGRVSSLLDLNLGLNPDFDGVRNILFAGLLMGISRRDMEHRLDEIAAFADLGEFLRQPLRTYSSGMRARLGFSIASCIDPEILIVDEVLGVGDELFRRKCYARMESMIRSGCTVLFASHNQGAIHDLCTRALLLDRGEILLQGPPKGVIAQYQRFLLCDPGSADAIRNEIRALGASGGVPDVARQADPGSLLESAGADAAGSRPTPGSQTPYFLPGLKSLRPVVSGTGQALLEAPRIRTPEGTEVNALVLNGRYEVSFRARFLADMRDVNAVVAFRTENGRLLCSFNLGDRTLPEAKAGASVDVRLAFRCTFAPAAYFATIGINAAGPEERITPAALHDALVFRVQPTGGNPGFRGLVVCDHRMEATLCAPEPIPPRETPT